MEKINTDYKRRTELEKFGLNYSRYANLKVASLIQNENITVLPCSLQNDLSIYSTYLRKTQGTSLLQALATPPKIA